MGQAKPLRRRFAVVVEDDPLQCNLVAELIEELDLEVVSCTTAETALDLLGLCGSDVALLITDVRLPGIRDGVALAEEVLFRWPGMKVVVMSGFSPPPTVPEGAIFLSKPWQVLDLVAHAGAFH